MIKLDYRILRDEGDEEKEYVPNPEFNEFSNVVYIEGPNSSGKSTLLNVIALAFYGDKLDKEDLNPKLKNRISELFESDHQKIEYKVEIKNEILNTHLIATKNSLSSKDRSVKLVEGDNERYIDADQLKKKYKLIYDIPENPMERLKEVLKDIRNSQRNRGHDIQDLKFYIKRIIDDIRDSRDPAQIEKLENEIKEETENLKNVSEEIKKQEEKVNELKKFFYSKFHCYFNDQLERTNKKLEELVDQAKSVEKKEEKNYKKFEKLYKEFEPVKEQLREAHSDLSMLLYNFKSDLDKYEMWKKADPVNEIRLLGQNNLTQMLAKTFKNQLEELLTNIDQEDLGRSRLIGALLNILEEFRNSDISVPGTNKKIDEFIEILNKEKTKHRDIDVKNKNIQEALEKLKLFLEIRNEALEIANKIKQAEDKVGESFDASEKFKESNPKDKLTKTKNELESKLKEYAKELWKIDVDPDKSEQVFSELNGKREFFRLSHYKENDMLEKLADEQGVASELKKKKHKLEQILSSNESELKRIKKKKPHVYQNYLDKLEKLFIKTQNLEKKLLVEFDGTVASIIENRYNRKLENDELKYANELSKYLARKVKNIRHVDKQYKIKKIDIVKGKVVTEEDKIINFSDMGTGQSQAAYLNSLLSMHDNKKIIALFDEVGMMDTNSISIILTKLRELYKKNKLLLAVVIQKADDINVKSII